VKTFNEKAETSAKKEITRVKSNAKKDISDIKKIADKKRAQAIDLIIEEVEAGE